MKSGQCKHFNGTFHNDGVSHLVAADSRHMLTKH